MLRILQNLPIRRKLMLLSLMISFAGLIAACGAFVSLDYLSYRSLLVRGWMSSADLIGTNSTAAISFKDQSAATEALSSFRDNPGFICARINTQDNQPFAGFSTLDKTAVDWMDQVPPDHFRFGGGALVVCRTIRLDGKPIGVIRICSDLSQLHERIRGYALALTMVVIAGLAASFLAVSWLQRFITAPILDLTQTARQVAEKKDYSVRAVKVGRDEMGTLIDCFNGMLEQLQQRDAQITIHRDHLEEQVKLRTTELSAARDRAEEANRAKSAFLANMSHEIRTPMTAILGYADLMLTPQQTMSDRVDSLQVVRRNARHLMDLINDILDISKIEAEKMTVEKIGTDVAQVAVEVVSMLRPRAVAKNLPLRVDFVGPIPTLVHTDPFRLKQVLMNLVGNAIKFTETGEVSLKVSVQPHGETSRTVFEVTDTGIGITPQQAGQLFKPFAQADDSMSRKYGGTGLGLAISKRLALCMGGDISVVSEAGRGTTFTFWCDGGALAGAYMRPEMSESSFAAPAPDVQTNRIALHGRILLAEDGIDNQRLLMLHLTHAGAEVVLVENGRLAVQKAMAESFDLILMDMQMPELDGYEATTTLRRLGCTLPIIALTAHAMSGDRAKCITAGCTDYMTKPIERDLLIRRVASYLDRPTQTAPARSPATTVADESMMRIVSTEKVEEHAALMHKAVAGFVARLPERVNTLIDLSNRAELSELHRVVHQLKGAGAGYGFPEITETAARADAKFKASAGVEELRAHIVELIDLMRKIPGYEPSQEKAKLSMAA